MGRHSVPDDDDGVVEAVEPAGDVLVEVAPRTGRHAAPDDDTTVADGATATATVESAEPATARRREPNADLRMLRDDPTLRTRCAAAVIVPFVLYTVVLLVIGRADVYLIWFWIPAVSAGVLLGSFLDAAARRKRRSSEDDKTSA